MTNPSFFPAQRLAVLLDEVRQAKPDHRSFVLFERRDALAELGVSYEWIDNFDPTDDAALDQHIIDARAMAWGLRLRPSLAYPGFDMPDQTQQRQSVSVTAARPNDERPFHLLPSPAYQDCLRDAVGSDGTPMGTLMAGAGLFAAGAPIVGKPRGGGQAGGGTSGKWTSPIAVASRSVVAPKTFAPRWVRDLSQEATRMQNLNLKPWRGNRTAYLGSNLGRIGSAASRTLGVGSMIGPVDEFVDAAKACLTKVGR